MIHMSNDNIHKKVSFLVGEHNFEKMPHLLPLNIFDNRVLYFLSELSTILLKSELSNGFSDIASFAFFCRKSNLIKLKRSYTNNEKMYGRGLSFHIAPSNVPINFAFSLVFSLLAGNSCIVRVSNQDFPQVQIISRSIQLLFNKPEHSFISRYISIIRYDHDYEVTSFLSALCDVRIIWGGDHTIHEIRKSHLSPRSYDVTFANRYSICLINSEKYLESPDKIKEASRFYNDTYFFDQNACSSPRLICWVGTREQATEAQNIFWDLLLDIIKLKKYKISTLSVIDKYNNLCKSTFDLDVNKISNYHDVLISRVSLNSLPTNFEMNLCHSGFFYEYLTYDLSSLRPVVTNKLQTITYIGFEPASLFSQLKNNNLLSFDRIVKSGYASDINLIWDGYDLINALSRCIQIS